MSESNSCESSKTPEDQGALESIWGSTTPQPFESESDLYEEIRTFYWRHVDLTDVRFYDVIASVTLLTYRIDEFETTPYLFALGPPNSGKTRLLECLYAACSKAMLTSNISSSALYQVVDKWHPSLLIDETELYRKDNERATELLAILNTGYRRGQHAIRGSRDGKKPTMYILFGFKALAGTEPLHETTMQRCVVMSMEKAHRDLPLTIDKQEAMKIRGHLEYYRLHHDGNPLDAEQIHKEIGDARVTELFLPLLGVTPTAEGRKRLLSLAKDIAQDRLAEEQSGVEAEILKAILGCKDNVESSRLSIKDIADTYNKELPDKEHVRSNWIERKLKRLGFKGTRFGLGGAKAVVWDQTHIERLVHRYLPDLDPKTSAEVILSPTLDDMLKLNQHSIADTRDDGGAA